MTNQSNAGIETLQIILDNTQALVYVTDIDTYEIIFANKALKRLFPIELEGHKCWKVLSSFTAPCPYCKLKDILSRPIGEPYIWDNYNADIDAWLQMNDSLVKWPDGRLVHLTTITDISSVKNSEQMLKAMSDNLPNSFVFQFKEEEGKSFPSIVYISKGVEKICHLSIEELGSDIGPLASLLYPDDLIELQKNAATGKAFNIELRLNVPGIKDTVWLSISEVPHKDKSGHIIWDGIAFDVTKRKKMEADLQKSQEELLRNAYLMRDISDNMTDSALYRTHLDKNGKIHFDYISSQMEEFAGVPIREIQKNSMAVFRHIHPDDREYFIKRVTATTDTLGEEVTEFRYIKNGEVLWFRIQSRGFKEEDGTIVRDGLLTNITKQKQLELQLITARDKAEESDKLKSTFLANMSHEIRTPMNAIVGFLEYMFTDDSIPRDLQKEYMRIVLDNANQLLKLIGDILDISKIDAGQMKIIPEETNINVLLQDIRASFVATGTIEEKGIELLIDESGQDKNGIFTLDSARLRQTLNNIIGNAIKFTDQGYVKFGYNVTKKGLYFYVKDTGIGISKEKLEDLGKPFHQLHDTTHAAKYGGTGIGLAISLNLVKLMGGTFHVQSKVGKGSLFEFTLPCKEIVRKSNTSKKTDSPSSVSDKSANIDDLAGRTILIVEDLDSNLGYLRTLLRQSHAKLLSAVNGVEAVIMVKNHPEIELVLMDVQMPIMDGLNATKQIKKSRPELPVIGQTAYVSPEDQKKMREAGFDDFVPKPVKRMALQEKIKKVLK